ncbi:hypothetical protein CVT24_012280 [Panaeolus cyanescens]|uniref:CxC2-like cysteine cluster KDZ transposase-associated domain-containing protein n=1 Tax=Panaeolus cyanescens TaxID=181874 RepID=A0A409WE39_9AGAR|nr:hypothetical protein CVT24_012280 [Panaeolus cyanescens]
MSTSNLSERPQKRPRTTKEDTGGSVHIPIPYYDPSQGSVRATEGRSVKVGYYVGAAITGEINIVGSSEQRWREAKCWEPQDSEDYALEDDGRAYEQECAADVSMNYDGNVNKGDGGNERDEGVQGSEILKRVRSMVSKRPNVVWAENFRSTYLDELLRHEGRGDYRRVTKCPDCGETSPAYRCISGCLQSDLVCKKCCLRRHKKSPLHKIEMWTGTSFTSISLFALGLRVQLNHAGMVCKSPIPCHGDMVVLHTNGIHKVAFDFCGCDQTQPHYIQLLRRRFYPATQQIVKTCASFELLDQLHVLSLTTQSSTWDFYRGLEMMTDATGLGTPSSRYRILMRMLGQWRHLQMLKRAGRCHDPEGVEATKPGQLCVQCPSCPYPGINLPADWTSISDDKRFLYRAFMCMDANFRLKSQLVSNYSQDPGLGPGWAYMINSKPYDAFVKSKATALDISTCVGFQAIAQANNRFSKGLRYTGVGGAFCARSDMVLPLGIGNLHKGERYVNMDYVFASALRQFIKTGISNVLISYDIACQWFGNLFKRFSSDQEWPDGLEVPTSILYTPAIPKLHEPMHQGKNHQRFSHNYITGVGLTDSETPERVWAGNNKAGNSTKTAGPGTRQLILDDYFNTWNWWKYITMGFTLARRFRAAVANRNIQVEAHRGLTAGIASNLIEKWTKICKKWEETPYPKEVENPYESDEIEITEAEVRKELAKEEEARSKLPGAEGPLNKIGPTVFVGMGLDIEDTQRRIQKLAKKATPKSSQSEGGLTEERTQLRNQIRAFEILQPIYMPGLLQYQEDNGPFDLAEHPEDHTIWLPSRIATAEDRLTVCRVSANLPDIEERLRTGRCYDALASLRRALKLKQRLWHFKGKNVRGQREGTRSKAIIDRVHERARSAAMKYRVSREAKLALSGPGDWEDALKILLDEDVRTFQEPKPVRKAGRPGTLEDGIEEQLHERGVETTDFSLDPVERDQRDGTGATRLEISWIWRTPRGQGASSESDEGDDILRVEWAKSRARAERATEEVQLLREEMRRVLEFLEWKASWWKNQAEARVLTGDKPLAEGLKAYAIRQSINQIGLKSKFKTLWDSPLELQGSDTVVTNTGENMASDDEDEMVD